MLITRFKSSSSSIKLLFISLLCYAYAGADPGEGHRGHVTPLSTFKGLNHPTPSPHMIKYDKRTSRSAEIDSYFCKRLVSYIY